MATARGLVDDDVAAFIRDVEEAFRVKLTAEELEHCFTVGDLCRSLQQRLELPDGSTGGCATAFSFYRLRSVLSEFAPTARLSPHTSASAISHIPVRKLANHITDKTGLRLPTTTGLLGCLALLLMIGAPAAALYSGYSGWLAASLAVLFYGLFRLSPLRLPGSIATLGDLAEHMAHRNIGLLASQGARLGDQETWSTLVYFMADYTGQSPSTIQPDLPLVGRGRK